jgi:hypothetical protein
MKGITEYWKEQATFVRIVSVRKDIVAWIDEIACMLSRVEPVEVISGYR